MEVIAKAAMYLGVGMVNLVNIFNPEMIIVGGGMSKLGDLVTAVNSLAGILRNENYSSTMAIAGNNVQRFDNHCNSNPCPDGIDMNDEYVDLYHFAHLVKLNTSNILIIPALITQTLVLE